MKNKQSPRKIVFLAVNSSYSHTNLAALYLQAFTTDMGFDWTTVEVVATEDFHPALHRIVQLKPDVLATTFYLFNRKAVLSILQRYRLLNPKCRIVAGGPEFLGDNRGLLTSERCIDVAFRGEGEHAFRQLMTNVDHPERWSGIPGFCGMVDGQYVDNGVAEEIRNLDDIPSPYKTNPPILGGLSCCSPLGNGKILAPQRLRHDEGGTVTLGNGRSGHPKGVQHENPGRIPGEKRDRRATETNPPILGGLSCCSPLGNGRQPPNGCGTKEADREPQAASTYPLGSGGALAPQGGATCKPGENPRGVSGETTQTISAFHKSKPFIQLETSRGCRNRCSFCTSGVSGAVRYFSIARVRSDLEFIRAAGVRNVRIVDRTFNENRSRCVELLRMFREEFGDMAFHLEIDPALIGDEVLREMVGRGRHAVVPPILGGLTCCSPLGNGMDASTPAGCDMVEAGRDRRGIATNPPILGGLTCCSPLGNGMDASTPAGCDMVEAGRDRRVTATNPPILGGLSCCSPLGNGKNAARGESTGRKEAARLSPTLHLDVGVQTFGAKVLKLVGRRGGSRNAVRGLKALCGLGTVAVHADLIAGLPGSTLKQTFKDLQKLVTMRPAEIQLELLKLLPGTRLSDERETFGIVAASDSPYEVLKTRDMTAEDVHAARLLCKLVDWFYEPMSLRTVLWQANEIMPGFWQELVAFCAAGPGPWTTPSLENRFRLMDEFLGGCETWDAERGMLENGSIPSTPTGCNMAAQGETLGMGGEKPYSSHRFPVGYHVAPLWGAGDARSTLQHALRYSWMKHGLSVKGGICEARPWKDTVPADAELVEGDSGAEICRMFAADIGYTYIFAYGRTDVDRKAVAVWKVGAKTNEEGGT